VHPPPGEQEVFFRKFRRLACLYIGGDDAMTKKSHQLLREKIGRQLLRKKRVHPTGKILATPMNG